MTKGGSNIVKQLKKQHKYLNPKGLKDYQWKPGQSGNLNGAPKGKQLKTWAKEFLRGLPDNKKLEFLKTIDPDIVWKMAEGNPVNTNKDDKLPESILKEFTDEELDRLGDVALEELAKRRAEEILEERSKRKTAKKGKHKS